MGLDELRSVWEAHGRQDPFWAILSEPGTRGNRWDEDAFFARGQQDADRLMGKVAAFGLPGRRDRCLDFGCGLGRVTQALARHFARADGVDVASSMIEGARARNREPSRCRYHHNPAADLALFPDGVFDLVYSNLVLQHIPPDLSAGYVAEFIRVLHPGGIAVFSAPCALVPAPPPTPMDPSAYRARIEVVACPKVVVAARPFTCTVKVVNAGDGTWDFPADPWLHVANHWLTGRGEMAILDDQRAEPPQAVPPGAAATVEFTLRAPTAVGRRRLEFDLVHDGVCWFADRGSPVAGADLWVVPGRRRQVPAEPGAEPWAMHILERDRAEAAVASAGGRLLAAEEEDVGRHRMVTYYATR